MNLQVLADAGFRNRCLTVRHTPPNLAQTIQIFASAASPLVALASQIAVSTQKISYVEPVCRVRPEGIEPSPEDPQSSVVIHSTMGAEPFILSPTVFYHLTTSPTGP